MTEYFLSSESYLDTYNLNQSYLITMDWKWLPKYEEDGDPWTPCFIAPA